jgi:hypothetical protein
MTTHAVTSFPTDQFAHAGASAPIASIVRQARLEYEEMPGLILTVPQAARLWSVDRVRAEHALRALVADGFLCARRTGFARTRQ